MAAAGPYARVPLPAESTDCVRLITVARDPENGKIRCCLHAIELKDAPPYLALSYSWHSPLLITGDGTVSGDDLFDIECNEEAFRVYYNLYYALDRLSRHPYTQRFFWIDAICIDQFNVDERNRQVHLMAQIYSRADQVIIWLGPQDEHSLKASILIDALCKLTRDQRRSINPYRLDQAETKEILAPPLHTMPFWISLAHFFRRNWFSRAWVIQEVLLSRDLVMLCGNQTMAWESLNTVSDYLATSNWAKAFRDPEMFKFGMPLPHHGGPAKLTAVKSGLSTEKDKVLLNSLIRARQYFCQDPRDKVFSLYGITLAHAADSTQVPKANYRLEVQSAYLEAAQYIVESSNDLHIMAHAEGSRFRNIPDLPSWVPDWSFTDDIGLGITGYKRYWAAGNLPRQVELLHSSCVLRLRAARLAHITICGESKGDAESTGTFPKWLEILRSLRVSYFNGQSSLEAFWRTLIGDTCPYQMSCPAPNSLRTSFESWLHDNAQQRICENVSSDWNLLKDIWTSPGRLHVPFTSPSEVPPRSFDVDNANTNTRPSGASKSLESASFGLAFSFRLRLKLFRTEEGLIGMGSESLDSGDTIWIVPGSRVPLIFRQKLGPFRDGNQLKYELVGGTYLHGLMHGEALHGDQKPLDFQTIEVE